MGYVSDLYTNVKSAFFSTEIANESVSIFLCGASCKNTDSIRNKVRNSIHSSESRTSVRIIYPEDLFEELLSTRSNVNMLTLEHQLADSVNAVAIVVESPGTFVELGAFSSHDKLARKLITIIDAKYKHGRSFINTGPVRKLKKIHQGEHFVIYHDFKNGNLSELASKITSSSKRIKTLSPISPSILNPVYSSQILLALSHILDPISKEELLETITSEEHGDEHLTNTLETSITYLFHCNHVTRDGNFIRITEEGYKELFRLVSRKSSANQITRLLHDSRIKYLNTIYRTRYLYSNKTGRPSLSLLQETGV